MWLSQLTAAYLGQDKSRAEKLKSGGTTSGLLCLGFEVKYQGQPFHPPSPVHRNSSMHKDYTENGNMSLASPQEDAHLPTSLVFNESTSDYTRPDGNLLMNDDPGQNSRQVPGTQVDRSSRATRAQRGNLANTPRPGRSIRQGNYPNASQTRSSNPTVNQPGNSQGPIPARPQRPRVRLETDGLRLEIWNSPLTDIPLRRDWEIEEANVAVKFSELCRLQNIDNPKIEKNT
ncbi:hypothetical protein C8J56DRAFT_898844 [Mycena floridula]|nr:hypothetical protein C8J56DRAFT_898844 [Mycena floridula]